VSTGSAVLDVTQYVRVNVDLNPLLLQAHRDSVRIVFNDTKPALSNTAFHILNGSDPIFHVPSLDVNVWVLAMTDTASLSVTEFGASTDNPIDTIEEFAAAMNSQLSRLWIDQLAVIDELRLLNLRFEVAFETTVTGADT